MSALQQYELQANNPYEGTTNALEEGRRLLAVGDLANAILHFEAAIKADGNSAAAWRMLGIAQSENEQELQAIAALRKAVELNPNDLDALFHLGNELASLSLPH